MKAETLHSGSARLTLGALLLCLLVSCELPPREAWRQIQREGLLSFMNQSYAPPSRYMSSAPFQTTRRYSTQVPYRPSYERSRYQASSTPYRPKPKSSTTSRPKTSVQRSIASAPSKPTPKKSQASAPDSKPAPSSPKPPVSRDAPKPSLDSLPFGEPVAGRPGMVTSPFAQKQQLVDVTGMAAGETVKDPYSGKLFRVPAAQQAAGKTDSAPDKKPAEAEADSDAKPKAQP